MEGLHENATIHGLEISLDNSELELFSSRSSMRLFGKRFFCCFSHFLVFLFRRLMIHCGCISSDELAIKLSRLLYRNGYESVL